MPSVLAQTHSAFIKELDLSETMESLTFTDEPNNNMKTPLKSPCFKKGEFLDNKI